MVFRSARPYILCNGIEAPTTYRRKMFHSDGHRKHVHKDGRTLRRGTRFSFSQLAKLGWRGLRGLRPREARMKTGRGESTISDPRPTQYAFDFSTTPLAACSRSTFSHICR
jgi:hypothetical protein